MILYSSCGTVCLFTKLKKKKEKVEHVYELNDTYALDWDKPNGLEHF